MSFYLDYISSINVKFSEPTLLLDTRSRPNTENEIPDPATIGLMDPPPPGDGHLVGAYSKTVSI